MCIMDIFAVAVVEVYGIDGRFSFCPVQNPVPFRLKFRIWGEQRIWAVDGQFPKL